MRTVYRVAGDQLVALGYATDDEVRRVKRQPAYVVERVRARCTAPSAKPVTPPAT